MTESDNHNMSSFYKSLFEKYDIDNNDDNKDAFAHNMSSFYKDTFKKYNLNNDDSSSKTMSAIDDGRDLNDYIDNLK